MANPSALQKNDRFLKSPGRAPCERGATGTRGATEVIPLDPLVLVIHAVEATIRFADSQAILLEVPASLDSRLRAALCAHCGGVRGMRFVFDLEDLPAISSRHLGLMLLARRACQPFGRIVLRHASPKVLYVLRITKLLDLFEREPE